MTKFVAFTKNCPWLISLSLISFSTYNSGRALADKLQAPPLPHASDLQAQKDFSLGQENAPSLSRFRRKPDYREEEAHKKVEENKVTKSQALEQEKLAQEARKAERAEADKRARSLQAAIDANNSAVELGKQGRWLDAIAEHAKAVQLDPRNKEFCINLSAARCAYGQQRLAQGDGQGAAHLFRQALTAAPDNGLAGKMLVEAIKKCGINPSSADARLTLGDELAQSGDMEGAAIEYQAAMQLEESARTYTKIGDIALHYGQIATAAQWYRQAVGKDPDFGAAHRQLGLIALLQKDLTIGATELRKAVILNPKDAVAGQALVEIWQKQVANNPSYAENHLGLAGALQLTNDLAGAMSEYRKVERLDPHNPQLATGLASLERTYQHAQADQHRLAAETLFNQGLRKEAQTEISQAVRLDPRNATYQLLLGECLEANGDYQGAHQAYLTCVLIDPQNNKEAAVRLKQMQINNPISLASAETASVQPFTKTNNVVAPVEMNQANSNSLDLPRQSSAPHKDIFEGGPGIGSYLPPNSVRTHEEGEAIPAASTPNQASTPGMTDPHDLRKVQEAEEQRDFAKAIDLLRPLLSANLGSDEMHHRMAVDLMNAGEITAAISEFRIAGALAPSRKEWSDDLAQALAIHKRSLMSSNSADKASSDGVTK
jgi:tetratricopeptide (TPR) repeat protein